MEPSSVFMIIFTLDFRAPGDGRFCVLFYYAFACGFLRVDELFVNFTGHCSAQKNIDML